MLIALFISASRSHLTLFQFRCHAFPNAVLKLFLFPCNGEALKSPMKCVSSMMSPEIRCWLMLKEPQSSPLSLNSQFLFCQPSSSFEQTTCRLDPVKDNVKMTNSFIFFPSV